MSINASELDFFNIKESLKTYLEQSDEFRDYDFEASGISNILDVLAYNTHMNGLIANMAVNESFLTSAQLRSSVLAHAESLGYTPKSVTSSTAVVNATVTIPDGPETITLDQNTEFSGDVDEVTFSFKTTEAATATNVGGTYTFKVSNDSPNITLKEGTSKTKTFFVDGNATNQAYVLTDDNIDTTSLTVDVYENLTTQEFTVYNNIDYVPTINNASTIYIIREAANGYYELQFSDGNTLGKAPTAGSRIVVRYRTSEGASANGATEFVTKNFAYNGDVYPIVVTTVAGSVGGSDKESIQSIKFNAPRAYASQQRLVTSADYEALISKTFGAYLKGVVAWGGNENVPPQFGKVFVSLQFQDGIDEQSQEIQKQIISDQLTSNLSIMSIDTEFVQPQTTYLEIITAFNADVNKSNTSLSGLTTNIESLIKEHFNTELNTFSAIFRRSQLLQKIDNLSPGILNSQMTVRAQQRIDEVVAGTEKDYTLNFPFGLASPDKDTHTVTTSIFSYNGQNVLIKNKLGSNILQIFDLNDEVKRTNVGTYDPAKGTVFLSGLLVDNSTELKVSAFPANQSTLVPLRNYILTLDESLLDVSGFIEIGTNKATL